MWGFYSMASQLAESDLPCAWLVASVSEASSLNKQTSQPSRQQQNKPFFLFQRTSSFSTRGTLCCVQQASTSFSPSINSFRVKGLANAKVVAVNHFPELNLGLLEDLDPAALISTQANAFASVIKKHVLPKANFLVSVQRQSIVQIERAGKWLASSKRRASGDGDAVRNGSSGGRAEKRPSNEERLAAQAKQAEANLEIEHAVKLYEQLVSLHPTAENYARLSKQYTDLMYVGEPHVSRERVKQLNTKAVELAGLAVEADPSACMGYIARCVSRGRLALVSDNRTKVHLAKEAADDAIMALKLDPNNDVAHHLMGRWHYEMAQINAVARYLIRLFFGASLMQGTFQDSLEHFRTAAVLCPTRAIHRVEIGRTLLKLGDSKGAVEELSHALEMEVEDINAHLQLRDAEMLLQKLKGSENRGLFFSTPGAEAVTDAKQPKGPRSPH